MPYVTIRVTGEKVAESQSRELIAGATQLLQEVLGKDPETTWVVIEEIATENWGIGGEPVTSRFPDLNKTQPSIAKAKG